MGAIIVDPANIAAATSVAPAHRINEIGRLAPMPKSRIAEPVIWIRTPQSGQTGSGASTKDRSGRFG
jgi:hypothetical protein